jgi:hypothetical protein
MYLNKEAPDEADYARFGAVLSELLEIRAVKAKLSDAPILVTLTREAFCGWGVAPNGLPTARVKKAPPRCVIYAPLFIKLPGVPQDNTRDTLNRRLGFEAFVTEGNLSNNEWPVRTNGR